MLRYDSHERGLNLTVQLSTDQAAALGDDAALLGEWMDTALVALASLRDPSARSVDGLKGGYETNDPGWLDWVVEPCQ